MYSTVCLTPATWNVPRLQSGSRRDSTGPWRAQSCPFPLPDWQGRHHADQNLEQKGEPGAAACLLLIPTLTTDIAYMSPANEWISYFSSLNVLTPLGLSGVLSCVSSQW